jgi:hypothetical protein
MGEKYYLVEEKIVSGRKKKKTFLRENKILAENILWLNRSEKRYLS